MSINSAKNESQLCWFVLLDFFFRVVFLLICSIYLCLRKYLLLKNKYTLWLGSIVNLMWELGHHSMSKQWASLLPLIPSHILYRTNGFFRFSISFSSKIINNLKIHCIDFLQYYFFLAFAIFGLYLSKRQYPIVLNGLLFHYLWCFGAHLWCFACCDLFMFSGRNI